MTKYTPTVDEVRDRYADGRTGIGEWTRFDESVKRAVDEAYAEFDRMIAEVERAAAAKALTDAADEEERVSQQYALTADGMRERSEWEDSNRYANYASGHAASAHALRARAEAYRQERGEQWT